MNAIILIGHGSLKKTAGATMIRLAAKVRQEGVVPLSSAAFLNFSLPTLAEAVERLVHKGAKAIYIQPYFLIHGYYVEVELVQQIKDLQRHYPEVSLVMGQALGYHDMLVDMVYQRYQWARQVEVAGLLLLAHGTPQPEANAPIEQTLHTLKGMPDVTAGALGYMECNTPTIPEAAQALVAAGCQQVVAVPYFLQFGRHVYTDLPEALSTLQAEHPQTLFTLTPHLNDEAQLAKVVQLSVQIPDQFQKTV